MDKYCLQVKRISSVKNGSIYLASMKVIIACPISYYLGMQRLHNFAYRIETDSVCTCTLARTNVHT